MEASSKPAEKVQEESCGWLCFRPSFLMKLSSLKIYLFFACCGVVMQGFIINGLINISITSLERRFSLSSAQTGLIAGMYDIAATLFSIPIAYAGGRAAASKPRWIGTGLIIMGTGALVFSLPHFLTGEFVVLGAKSSAVCGAGTPPSCDSESGDAGVSSYLYVFLLAQVLHGIGAAPLWSLSIAYIEANVQKKMVSMFLAVYYTMALVGPAIGYLGGSFLLVIHTDFATTDVKSLGLTPRSEGWVGAWWLGFLCAAFVTWLAAIPVLAFPRHLPQARDLSPDTSETHAGRDSQQLEQIDSKLAQGRLQDLPAAVWECITNPTFLCISLAGGTDGAVLAGASTFMPKYMQNQFALPASQAGLFTGVAALVGGATGTVIGGYVVKRFQLRCTGMLKLICAFSAFSFFASLIFLAACPNAPFAGVNTEYGDRSPASADWLAGNSSARLVAPCNADCGCDQHQFSPICGADGLTYFSACYAGCTTTDISSSGSCRCYSDVRPSSEARRGRCRTSCSYLPLIVVGQTLVAFSVFIGTSPSSTAIVRSVSPRQRSLALGISMTLLRVIGTIPGPIIYGALIDRSCQLWLQPCNQPGACAVYDNFLMSRYLLGANMCWKLLSLLLYNLAWILYKAPEGSEEYPVVKVDKDGKPVSETSDDPGTENGGVENPAFQEAS